MHYLLFVAALFTLTATSSVAHAQVPDSGFRNRLAYDRRWQDEAGLGDCWGRALWGLGAREQTPFLHHWVNVLLHGVNGALVCVLALQLTKRRSTAWLAGLAFTASAANMRG